MPQRPNHENRVNQYFKARAAAQHLRGAFRDLELHKNAAPGAIYDSPGKSWDWGMSDGMEALKRVGVANRVADKNKVSPRMAGSAARKGMRDATRIQKRAARAERKNPTPPAEHYDW